MPKIVAQCLKSTCNTQHYLNTLPKTYPTLIHRGEDPSRLSGPIAYLNTWGSLGCRVRLYTSILPWAELYRVLIHWTELYPNLIHWTEIYPILMNWVELYPILIHCRTLSKILIHCQNPILHLKTMSKHTLY